MDDLLASIWGACHPGVALPAPTGAHWKTLGFQGMDPRTDIRGARVMGLRYLARALKSDPTLPPLMKMSNDDDGFPFAASALNVYRVLVIHLQLTSDRPRFCPCCSGTAPGPHRGPPTSASMSRRPSADLADALAGFAQLLQDDKDALFSVFCGALHVMHRSWHQHMASMPMFTLLQFGEVLAFVRQAVMRVLSRQPSSSAMAKRGVLAELRG